MNSATSRYLGSAITANMIFFLIAFISALLIFILLGDWKTVNNIKLVPNWLFLSGVISAFMILGSVFLIPRMGAGQFFVLLLSGQILMAILIGHYGFLELPQDSISLTKLIGAGMVIIGAYLSTR